MEPRDIFRLSAVTAIAIRISAKALGDAPEELPEELRTHRIVYLEKPETVDALTHNEDVTLNARSKDKDALKTVEEMLRDETFRIKTIEEE